MHTLLRDPEYSWIRVLLFSFVAIGMGFFVFNYSNNDPLSNQARVYGDIRSGLFGMGTDYPTGGREGSHITIGDFNEDGDADVIVSDYDSGVASLKLLTGNGTGALAATSSIPLGSIDVSIIGALTSGDFDKDGHLDVLADYIEGSPGVSRTRLLQGDGTGSFTSVDIPPLSGYNSMTPGDFNEDGNLDVASTQGGDIFIFNGNGAGAFTLGTTVPSGNAILTTGDFNEDGHLDLATTQNGGSLTLFAGDGAGGFTVLTTKTTSSFGGLAAGDFNNDGNLDIVAAQGNGIQIEIFSGDGAGGLNLTLTTNTGVGHDISDIRVGDLDSNGSGRMDVVIAMGTAIVGVYLNPSVLVPINVTSTTADGIYSAVGSSLDSTVGVHVPTPQTIDISIQLNTPATVDTTGGVPQLILQTGPSATTAVNYVSGSGTDTLHFSYTVTAGDTSLDLEYQDVNALVLNGASIKDTETGVIDLSPELFTPGAAGSLSYNKALVIDTTPPVVTEVTPVTTPTTDHTPSYAFSTNELLVRLAEETGGGPGGSLCYMLLQTPSPVVGINEVTFGSTSIPDGTYACTFTPIDLAWNQASTFHVSTFVLTTPSGTTGGGTSGGGTTGGRGGGTTIVIAPFLTERIPVPTPSLDTTPSYTFESNESGMLLYGGACSSSTTFAMNGLNPVTFSDLAPGTYSNCTVQLSDLAGRKSNMLVIAPFTITAPIIVTETEPIQPAPEPVVPVTPVKPVAPVQPTPVVPIVPVLPEPEVPVIVIPEPEPVAPVVETPEPTPVTTQAPTDTCMPGTRTSAPGMILDEIMYQLCNLSPRLTTAFTEIKTLYNENHGDILLKITATLAVLSATLTTFMSGLFLNPLGVSELALIPGRIVSLFIAGLGFKKRAPWGVAYDSVTKARLDPVVLELRNANGAIVDTTVTNIDGTFSFATPLPGTYSVNAKKSSYSFPSEKFVGMPHDEVYRNLSHGEQFTVSAGVPMALNIPIDPAGFDWTKFALTEEPAMKTNALVQKIITAFVNVFFAFGFIASLVAVVMTPDTYNTALFGIAVIAFFIKRKSLFGHAFGYVRDIATGFPVSFGIVRIISLATNKPIVDVVLDATGRYAYPLPDGTYGVRIDQKLPDGTYRTLADNLSARATQGFLSHDFVVTEQDPRSYLGFKTQ